MVVDAILVTTVCVTIYMSLPWVIDLENSECMSGAYSYILHSISFVMHIHLSCSSHSWLGLLVYQLVSACTF